MIERCALCGGLLTQYFYVTLSTGDKVCEMCLEQKMRERRERYGNSDGSSE